MKRLGNCMPGVGILLGLLLMVGAQGKAQEVRNETAETVVANEEVRTIRLDGMAVTWIRDNAAERRMARSLFPDASDRLIGELGLVDGVPSSVSTFLVETEGVKVLFDAGNGKADSRLLAGLRQAGVEPADIDYLFLTHFHGDHIGGMMEGDSVVFPRAAVYASRVEYEAWMQLPAGKNTRQVKTMDAYRERLHLFEWGDTLPAGIRAIDAAGHTPGHTAFRVGRLLVIGDLIHGAAIQLPHPEICATYDMDKEVAVASRIRLLQYARKHRLLLAGMHLPCPAFREE